MGMDQKVSLGERLVPSWPTVRDFLKQHGVAVQMRMIDGQLAFPDEEPPESWKELRVAVGQAMVTFRRAADGVVFVTWGNADLAMRQAWNALTWAYAELGIGTVATAGGVLDAAAFRRQAEMPPGLG